MTQTMKQAVVSGSAGFIGRHLVQALQQRGYTVHQVDIKTGLDCRDYYKFWPDKANIEVFCHCAANVGGREKIDYEPLWVADDLSIDAATAQWIVKAKPKHVVWFSSSAAYPLADQGGDDPGQLREDYLDFDPLSWAPFLPENIYGWIKLTGEYLVNELRKAVPETQIHLFRPFGGYGTDQDLSYPFPALLKQVKEKANPVKIWGSGLQQRDWIHSQDVVGAVLAAVDNGILGPVNLCTGIGTSFDDVVKLMWTAQQQRDTAAGRPVADPLVIEHVDKMPDGRPAPAGVDYRVGDPTLMHTFYKPKVTLEEGIMKALRGTP